MSRLTSQQYDDILTVMTASIQDIVASFCTVGRRSGDTSAIFIFANGTST